MTTATREDSRKNARDDTPWWRQSYCWLVISGPLVVVIAGFITMFIAYHGADTLAPTYVEDHHAGRVPRNMQPAEVVSKGAVMTHTAGVSQPH